MDISIKEEFAKCSEDLNCLNNVDDLSDDLYIVNDEAPKEVINDHNYFSSYQSFLSSRTTAEVDAPNIVEPPLLLKQCRKMFICPNCNYRTKQENRYKEHIAMHSFRYKCSECHFVSVHRFIVMNHFQMNHVRPPQDTVYCNHQIPDEFQCVEECDDDEVYLVEPEYVMPERCVLPERRVLPERHVLPERSNLPKQLALPERRDLPKRHALPERHVLPKQQTLPDDEVYLVEPEYVMPERRVLPERHVLPEWRNLPKRHALSERHVLPKRQALPERYALPEQHALPEPEVLPCDLFNCNVCNYVTTTTGNLENHMKTHMVNHPYKCNLCSFTAHKSFIVLNHYQLNHTDDPVSDVPIVSKCHVCGLLMTDSATYKDHSLNCYIRNYCFLISYLTTSKSYRCSMCDFTAPHSFILTNHVRMAHEYIDSKDPAETSLSPIEIKEEEFIIEN